ncbi:MAG: hypothetical protein IH865_00140 [Chloroflexi bacterium]|nr:hypothetical protein [Chloroflexota bacterium]
MRLRDLIDWPRSLLPEDPTRPLSISLANGTEREGRARDQLLRLLDLYNLRRWQFTNRVRIEQGVIAHSHPVLTVNTLHPDDDSLALSTYLHEQLHWFTWRRYRKARRALGDLRSRYPDPPIAFPEGAGDKGSSYLHYLVCYLEYWSMIEVVGPEEARRVMEARFESHYTEIYRTVLRDFEEIGEIVSRYDLLP